MRAGREDRLGLPGEAQSHPGTRCRPARGWGYASGDQGGRHPGAMGRGAEEQVTDWATWGREGGRIGGARRAANLSPEERVAIAREGGRAAQGRLSRLGKRKARAERRRRALLGWERRRAAAGGEGA
jgi:hypothetical protein